MLCTEVFKQPKNNFPFYVSKSEFVKKVFVNIDLLHPNQWEIDFELVGAKIKNKKMHTELYTVLVNDRYVLIDGHHTCAAKILQGKTKVKTYFIDLSSPV